MKRVALIVVAALGLTAYAATAQAQGKFPPDKFVNLQILPPDAPLDTFDFASDTKPQKQAARMMMRMSAEINAQITKAMPEAPAKGYQVTCYTCHKGAQHPQHSPDAKVP